MMVLIGGVILVLGFIFFMKVFGLVENSKKVIAISHSSAGIVRDANLDDHQKEMAMKKSAKELFSLFILIAIGSIAALAIPFGVVWLMERAGILLVDEVIEMTLSFEFIVITVIIFGIYFWFRRRKNE